ncbi:MAG TPA: hypothetical protein VHK91_06145 [Flavisolibacter sp.]|jgi:hypothetical protein|nr:hypothetical protein [Flavisolibacter sp.]
MKGALTFLFLGMAFLAFIYFQGDVRASGTTIDLHIRDAYIVIERSAAILISTLFLGSLFSFGGLLGSFFRSKVFWILTLLFLAGDAYYLYQLYR